MVMVTPQNSAFVDAVRTACQKLGYDAPPFAFAVSHAENGYAVALVDLSEGDERYLQCRAEARTPSWDALPTMVRELTPRGEQGPVLVFLLSETEEVNRLAGSWTLVHTESVEPRLHNGEPIAATYAQV